MVGKNRAPFCPKSPNRVSLSLMEKKKFDLIVIGSGVGGYVAAIRAAQNGLQTCLIESRETGGTCLNRGCIPSKTLIANAEVFRKIRNAEKYGITVEKVSFDYAKMVERKESVVQRLRRGVEGLVSSNKITLLRGFAKFLFPMRSRFSDKMRAL